MSEKQPQRGESRRRVGSIKVVCVRRCSKMSPALYFHPQRQTLGMQDESARSIKSASLAADD